MVDVCFYGINFSKKITHKKKNKSEGDFVAEKIKSQGCFFKSSDFSGKITESKTSNMVIYPGTIRKKLFPHHPCMVYLPTFG